MELVLLRLNDGAVNVSRINSVSKKINQQNRKKVFYSSYDFKEDPMNIKHRNCAVQKSNSILPIAPVKLQ